MLFKNTKSKIPQDKNNVPPTKAAKSAFAIEPSIAKEPRQIPIIDTILIASFIFLN